MPEFEQVKSQEPNEYMLCFCILGNMKGDVLFGSWKRPPSRNIKNPRKRKEKKKRQNLVVSFHITGFFYRNQRLNIHDFLDQHFSSSNGIFPIFICYVSKIWHCEKIN
jgi:hypothetical protein